MFEMRFDRTDTESVGCLKTPGTTSANGAVAFCREGTLVFMEQHPVSSSLGFPTPTSSSGATTKPKKSSSCLGPRSKCRIGASAVEQSLSPRTAGKLRPNQSFQGTKTRALRGFCPVNSDR